MIDPLLRTLARLLFLYNVDAMQICVEYQPLYCMWKNLLEQVQRNQTISTQPLKNALALEQTTMQTMNSHLNQAIATLPKQLGNLFFSAYKCLCGQLVKKFSFIVYDDSLADAQKIHICQQCKSAMQPITAPSVLAVVGNQCLKQIPCNVVVFGEQYVLMDAFLMHGSYFQSFIINEAATNEKSVGKYGVPFGERDFALRESQRLLFGSGMQGCVHCAFYCKLNQIETYLQARLLYGAYLIDNKVEESAIYLAISAPQSPQSISRQEISLLPASTQPIYMPYAAGVAPQNVIKIGASTVPVYLLISLMFLAFFAAFAFFGDIAIFVEIGKAKKRVLALEGATPQ